MRYFEHRPLTFWFSVSSALAAVLVASFLIGVYTQKNMPAPLGGNRIAAASDLMSAYGSVLTAPNHSTAKAAAAELVEVAENCKEWGMPGCAEVVQQGLIYVAALEDAIEGEEEGSEVSGPLPQAELVALRRNVGDAVNRVVTSTP